MESTSTQTADAPRAGRLFLASALVIGLALRIAVLLSTSGLGTPIVDEQHYTQLAANILQGHGFAWGPGQPTSIRPPLYPGLVAALWWIGGEGNLQIVRAAQILIALASTALVYAIGRRAFGVVAARYGASLFWLYPSLVFFNFTILTETLFTFLLLAFLLLTLLLIETPRHAAAVGAGVALGLAALTRSVLWPLPFVLCPLLLLLLRGPYRTRLTAAVLVATGFAAIVTPWAVRNTRLQGVTTIVDTMGGLNLRMGNYEHTPDDRMWAAVDLQGELGWSHALTQELPGVRLTEGQKDKWAQKKALAYMRAHPAETARRALIKFADFWGIERELAAGVQQAYYAPPVWFASTAPIVIALAYLGVALAGAAGIWLCAPGWRAHVVLLLPVVAIMGAHTIAFGHSRYHLPLVPILGLYASSLVVSRPKTAWSVRRLAVAGAAATVLVLIGVWVRQVLVVDAARIRALIDHVG